MKQIKEEELIIKALPKLSRQQMMRLYGIMKGMIRYNLYDKNNTVNIINDTIR